MICVSASALRTLTEGAARTGEAEDPEVPWPGSGPWGWEAIRPDRLAELLALHGRPRGWAGSRAHPSTDPRSSCGKVHPGVNWGASGSHS